MLVAAAAVDEHGAAVVEGAVVQIVVDAAASVVARAVEHRLRKTVEDLQQAAMGHHLQKENTFQR